MALSHPESNEPRPARHGRRWYQFSLRALFALTLLAAVLLAAWVWYVEPYRVQRKTMELIERLGGTYQAQTAPIWLNRITSANLQNVTLVNLANSDPSSEDVAQVAGLPCLEILALGGQWITDRDLDELQRARTLRWLVLDSASVTDARVLALQEERPDLHVYRSQRRVLVAIRASNPIAWAVPCPKGSIRFPAELEQLGVEFLEQAHEASVHDASHVARLAGAEHLERLDLDRAQISDTDLVHLARMRRLKTLYLTNRKVTDVGLAHLAGLSRLELLDLSGTPVTDAGLVHLAGLSGLKELCICRTGVSDAGLVHLNGLKNLATLRVTMGTYSTNPPNRRITREGVSKLQELLPDCTVEDHDMRFIPRSRIKE